MKNATREQMETISGADFSIEQIGEPTLASPLKNGGFVPPGAGWSYFNEIEVLEAFRARNRPPPAFEAAGPREKIFHDPSWTRAAIITCGGLCPGLNHVIKALVNTLYYSYGVNSVFGIQYGYRGLIPTYRLEPVQLNPDTVDSIHESGGSLLGSSRGEQNPEEIVRSLDRLNLNVLFTIGGDGTLRGAAAIAQAARKNKFPVSVVGVPKTIDNDIDFMDRTFGFETAVHATTPVISCAHAEAKGAYNGISIVRLMGRDAGFIAASATLANPVVNVCLVPEVPFTLEGANGLLPALVNRLREKQHCVIVVAEGSGQDLFTSQTGQKDASGNLIHHDIGFLLRDRIHAYLNQQKIEHAIKYFDPSYLIRGIPAEGTDAIFCLHLAQHAVHAAMAGKTNLVVGHWHGNFTHVPIGLATRRRRCLSPDGQLWQSVINVTRQENYWQTEK